MGAGADPSQVRPFPRPRSSNRTCGFSPIRLSDWFHRRLTNARPSLNGPTDALVLRLGEGLLRRAAREEEIALYGGARAGLQMDVHPLPLLERPSAVPGRHLSGQRSQNGLFLYSALQNMRKCRELLESVCEKKQRLPLDGPPQVSLACRIDTHVDTRLLRK